LNQKVENATLKIESIECLKVRFDEGVRLVGGRRPLNENVMPCFYSGRWRHHDEMKKGGKTRKKPFIMHYFTVKTAQSIPRPQVRILRDLIQNEEDFPPKFLR